ncbi:MAG: helix-turn-helix domain-containing protein [Oliverpabstia sp.]
MQSYEAHVAANSQYFIHLPSTAAQHTFFYPIHTGYFIYEPGYSLTRDAYDSFLLMYIEKGQLVVEYENKTQSVSSGNFILLDCYKLHSYHMDTDCEILWMHFDGPSARPYYDLITTKLGYVFFLSNPYSAVEKLSHIYQSFLQKKVLSEALLSKLITDILTVFLTDTSILSAGNLPEDSDIHQINDIVTFINEHISDNLSVSELANRAMLSNYHFIRIFKKHTGFTPHEYVRNIRISTARYLLKTTELTVKDICFRTGFSCESVFCTAFKNKTGTTPAQFRSLASTKTDNLH